MGFQYVTDAVAAQMGANAGGASFARGRNEAAYGEQVLQFPAFTRAKLAVGLMPHPELQTAACGC